MVGLRWFGSMALLTVLLAGSGSRAEEQPKLLPTRDVDVRYDVTRPQTAKGARARALARRRAPRAGRCVGPVDLDL